MKNEMKINSRRKHTVEELAKLPQSFVTETQYKQLRSLVFIKGLDIVQAHKASGLCVVTEEDWAECTAWYNALCAKDWTAFERVPLVVYKHLPEHLKQKVKTGGVIV